MAMAMAMVQLRQEKVDIENQLEREQEYVVNKLRKQLAQVCCYACARWRVVSAMELPRCTLGVTLLLL